MGDQINAIYSKKWWTEEYPIAMRPSECRWSESKNRCFVVNSAIHLKSHVCCGAASPDYCCDHWIKLRNLMCVWVGRMWWNQVSMSWWRKSEIQMNSELRISTANRYSRQAIVCYMRFEALNVAVHPITSIRRICACTRQATVQTTKYTSPG